MGSFTSVQTSTSECGMIPLPRALSLDVNSHLLCPVTHRAERIFDLGLRRVAKPERPNQSVARAKLWYLLQ